jgi:hypothetical protein
MTSSAATQGDPIGMDNVVVRSIPAPTEAEARDVAGPMLDAFRAAGWELREALWIPGDRRPGLGESLILSPESQLLLESEGVLRLSFAHTDPMAIAPSTEAATRVPDTFEAIGGVRYRRLVPRWGLGLLAAAIGLIVVLAFASSMPGSPFGPAPTPDGGICPVGWIPGMDIVDGVPVENGTCQRVP